MAFAQSYIETAVNCLVRRRY